MNYRIASLLAAATLFVGACSDDDPGEGAPDAGAPDASTPDAGTPDASEGPDADPCADPTAALPTNYRPIDAVSTGVVEVVDSTATIDASAGGGADVADTPFVYLKFTADGLIKVDITDVDSYDNATWDLAIKRFVFRVNGGDSGTGGVSVAIVAAETLADVTELPPEDAFITDDWFSEECTLNVGQTGGEPATALVNWYDYDFANNVLSPKAEVYVLKLSDGSVITLDIKDYYHDDTDAHYEIEWGAL